MNHPAPSPPLPAAVLPPCAPDVLTVRPLGDHAVAVTLADGRSGTLDLSWLLGYPAFARLREPQYFARVAIAYGTLAWPDGEDVSPESVSARLRGAA